MSNARLRRAGGKIGDNALCEAFARLPDLRDLLNCAATCKHWRRLVADRDILRRVGLWRETARRPSVLAGIFFENDYSTAEAYQLSAKKGDRYAPPLFLTLQAGLPMHGPTFDSFVATDDMLFNLARPLAARRGILLARVVAPFSPGDLERERRLHLAVIDKRTTHLLPPPPVDLPGCLDCSLKGCAIITAKDFTARNGDLAADHRKPPTFQVLLIYNDDANEFVFACTYSFGSETAGGTWSAPVKCCGASELTRCGPRAGIVTRGSTAHWLFMNDRNSIYTLLNVNAATSHVSMTEIPIKAARATVPRSPIPCIVGEEGLLSFVTLGDNGVEDLWTKQKQDDEGDGVWQCSELANLGRGTIGTVFFAESKGALLVEHRDRVFSIVDLISSKEKAPVHFNYERIRLSEGTHQFLPESCSSSCCRGHVRGGKCIHTPPVLFEMDILSV